jgi:predicted transcriptional regulator
MDTENIIKLVAEIVSAHVSHNNVATSDLPLLVKSVYESLASAGKAPEPMEEKREPAVSIRASVKHDYLVCLEDGKKLKMLKRHLATHYNLTPEEYRVRWNLPADYPMVAPAYAEKRRDLAKSFGLGRQLGAKVKQAAPKAVKVPAKKKALPAPEAPSEAPQAVGDDLA